MAAKYARTVAPLVVLVALMVALAFASVPLYRLFCQVTGFGGTPKVIQKTAIYLFTQAVHF